MSVLQQRNLLVELVDLCPAMDLIAIYTKDGFLCIHRTISWERVYVKKMDEILSDEAEKLVCLKFSLDGKYLSLGCSGGRLLLIDIEFHNVYEKQLSSQSVEKVLWLSTSNLQLLEKCSVPVSIQLEELFERETSDSSNGSYSQKCFQHLSQALLLAFMQDFSLNILAYGMEVILHLDLSLGLPSQFLSTLNWKEITLSATLVDHYLVLQLPFPENSNHTLSLISTESLKYLLALQRLSYLSLTIANNQKKVEEITYNLARKWKDCIKTIPPKLQLLQTLLNGYEMKLTVIEFLHSITLCGLWHPAALTSFPQHWNDQGILRLRSSIDSTTKFILRGLQFKVYPLLMNLFLLCSEYLAILWKLQVVLSSTDESLQKMKQKITIWDKYRLQLIDLLFSYDALYHEAKYTREAMLDYLAFVKDCFNEATNSTNSANASESTAVTIDFELREKCSYYFEPKTNRAPIQNAEYITGSHLFSHLSDLPIPRKDDAATNYETEYNCLVFHENIHYASLDPIVYHEYLQQKQSLIEELMENMRNSIVEVFNDVADEVFPGTNEESLNKDQSMQPLMDLMNGIFSPILTSATSDEKKLRVFYPLIKKISSYYQQEVQRQTIDMFDGIQTSSKATASSTIPSTVMPTSILLEDPSIRILDQKSSLLSIQLLHAFSNNYSSISGDVVIGFFTVYLVQTKSGSYEMVILIQAILSSSQQANNPSSAVCARISIPTHTLDNSMPKHVLIYDRTAASINTASDVSLDTFHLVLVAEKVDPHCGESVFSILKLGIADLQFKEVSISSPFSISLATIGSVQSKEEEDEVVVVAKNITGFSSADAIETQISETRGILWLQQQQVIYVVDLEAEVEDEDSETEVKEMDGEEDD